MRSLLAFALCLTLCGQNAAADAPVSHRVLGADKGRLAIVEPDGKVSWEHPCKGTPHDLTLLESSNVLFINADREVLEVSPAGDIVWQYKPQPTGADVKKIEVHAAQRLADGNTLVAETGNRRLVEVDSKGNVVKSIPLTIDKPHPHRDTRMARKLPNGHYLVCHEGDSKVREYDPAGKVVWTYTLDLAGRPEAPGHGVEGHGTAVYGALRLASGNTLIACGNGNRVIEVDPTGKTVWSIEQNELPGIQLAWVTTLHALPNGNVIFGNCHAGEANPQVIEVNRDKKVVWTLRNFETFGNSLAAVHIVDAKDAIR
ncbi:Arylsulfotransferase (ASST) [Caulifigura coniformis]|uniref:Arylsulfotransferase (ASST) n=1 Tax=Caulifigura coniformis TaxID=2527983 RepID=A0A517SFM2_9PLAN|nr:PQQ-binding-like beta-propeller repeat protein [Caulifigura coniformis]QDT54918.1 Arylsulfotransferase (ASST) [Caulifigura coniformis]